MHERRVLMQVPVRDARRHRLRMLVLMMLVMNVLVIVRDRRVIVLVLMRFRQEIGRAHV